MDYGYELDVSTLYLFIDESGNFDFTSRGTRHFVMACVIPKAPLSVSLRLQALRYSLLARGVDLPGFHASQDRQKIRDQVFQALEGISETSVFTVFGHKQLVDPALRTDSALHTMFVTALIRLVSEHYGFNGLRQIVVILDQALTRPKQRAFHLSVKPFLRSLGLPFHVYFQSVNRDMNGQIADYVSWSKFVALERNEHRPWSSLQKSLRPRDFDIFGT